jgi:nucleoside-diphosphate-sugar epimerase
MKAANWILVTGGTGFIGFAFVKHMLATGYSVRIVSRGSNTNKELEKYLLEITDSRLELFIGDIKNQDSIRPAFENVSHVFHSAALLNSFLPYERFYEANVSATRNICELCLEYNVSKLIYISTCDVFGLPEKNRILSESSPYSNWSEPYADTKIIALQLVKDYQQKGLISTIYYPGWVYGPGDRAFMPAILEFLQSGMMPVWDGGKYNLCLVYIDDFVDAVILALDAEETANEDFLILDDNSQTTMEDISRILGELFKLRFKIIRLPYWIVYFIGWTSQKLCLMGLGKKPLLSTTDVKSLGKNFKYSTEKAKKILGWDVKVKAQHGLSEWKSWFEEYHGKTDALDHL